MEKILNTTRKSSKWREVRQLLEQKRKVPWDFLENKGKKIFDSVGCNDILCKILRGKLLALSEIDETFKEAGVLAIGHRFIKDLST